MPRHNDNPGMREQGHTAHQLPCAEREDGQPSLRSGSFRRSRPLTTR